MQRFAGLGARESQVSKRRIRVAIRTLGDSNPVKFRADDEDKNDDEDDDDENDDEDDV